MKANEFHNRPLSEINVTPFVDVVLVLLIVFMITAPLISQGLDVDLPEATAPSMTRSEHDIMITMNQKGEFFIQDDKTAYTLESIEKKLSQIFEHREKKEILLRADKNIPYGTVVRAIALFKQVGVDRVGMITEEEKEVKRRS